MTSRKPYSKNLYLTEMLREFLIKWINCLSKQELNALQISYFLLELISLRFRQTQAVEKGQIYMMNFSILRTSKKPRGICSASKDVISSLLIWPLACVNKISTTFLKSKNSAYNLADGFSHMNELIQPVTLRHLEWLLDRTFMHYNNHYDAKLNLNTLQKHLHDTLRRIKK